jgi:hypothetical protein
MLVFGLIGTLGGICILVWVDPLFRFFTMLSDTMTIYSEKLRRTALRPANLRLAGVLAITFGLVCFAILAWRLLNGRA